MPSKTQSILLGGIVAAVAGAIVSFIPLVGGYLGCLAYLIAGLVAVWHYTETHALTISGGTGAGMGAGAGVVAGLIGAVVSFLLQALGLVPGFSEGIDQAVATGQIPAGQAETLRGFVNSPLFYIAVLAFLLIIGAIMGAIGGAIGASVFKQGGDTPGGGSPGGGPSGGGPREPAGDRPQTGGPREARPQPGEEGTGQSYRPAREVEEETATRQP